MNAPVNLTPSTWLRMETRPDHDRVDRAYSRFDLATVSGYAAFLTAQARVLPQIEDLVDPGVVFAGWRGRARALLSDLAVLGLPRPEPQWPELPGGSAARWGALYVLEGSRLGGAVLSRRVPADMPHAFLDATHRPGEWRAFLTRLDRSVEPQADRAGALAGARATFHAFVRAALSAG